MALALHLAWMAMTVLRFGEIITMFACVVLFGIFFIGGNARVRDGHIPVSSWQAPGPKKGMKIAALGALMLLAAFAINALLPNGL